MSLAFSDLAVELFPQLMSGVISAVVLKMASSEENTFTSFCPTVLTVYYYLLFLLGAASFLTVTAIAIDRLLAVSLHLRYQELVTSKRVITILVFLWLTSCITAFIYWPELLLIGDFNTRVGSDHQAWPSCLGHHGSGKMDKMDKDFWNSAPCAICA